jgi:hypothetical protein
VPEPVNNKLWHIPFNRVNDDLIVDMVHSYAHRYYGYEFMVQARGATLPRYAVDYYVRLYVRNKRTLRASFRLYQPWDAHVKQNMERKKTRLTMPILGIGGQNSWGPMQGTDCDPQRATSRTC